MAYDGSLIFDTKIDESGFKKGISGLKGVASTSMKVVGGLIAGASTAIVGMGVASVKVGSQFESSMSQVAATMGITVEQIRKGDKSFEMLKQAAKDAGATTMFSASQSAEALNYLALAGYDAETAVKTLPKVLNLAAAGGIELAYASDLITDSMAALGLSVDYADTFVDQMAKTSQKSNTNVAQLGEAILTVGANARDLKGGTVELSTALGMLANVGLKGAESGTKLRNIIMAMTPTTDKAVMAFEALGVQTYDASGELRGLDEIFRDLNNSMANMTTEEKKNMLSSIFNKQDMGAALSLLASTADSTEDLHFALNELGVPIEKMGLNIDDLVDSVDSFSNAQEFAKFAMSEFGMTAEQAEATYNILKAAIEGDSAWKDLENEIRNAEGAAQDMADTLNDNLKGDVELLKSALEGLGISIYEGMNTPLRDVTQTLTGYVDQINAVFSKQSDMKKMMEETGMSAEEVSEKFKHIPDGLEGAIELVGTILADMVLKVSEQAPKLVDAGVKMIQALLDGIQQNLPQIISATLEVGQSLITGILEILPQMLVLGIEVIANLVQGIAEMMPTLIPLAVEAINTIINGLMDNIPLILEAGVAVIVALVQGLSDNLPELITKAIDLIITICDSIIENLPLIINAALLIITALTEGIVDNLPTLIKEVPRIINAFSDAIYSALPTILLSGIKIILELIKGLIQSIPTLVANIPQIIMAIVNVITLYKWWNLGSNIITWLKDGIVSMVSNIASASSNLASSVMQAIKDVFSNAPSVGKGLVQHIITGIEILIEALISTVRGMASKVLSTLSSGFTGAFDIGADMVKGLWNGINSVKDWILGKISGFTSEIMSGIKGFFGIRSPSTRMRDEVGKFLPQGIGVGIEEEMPKLQRNIDNEMSKLTAKMKATVDFESGNVGRKLTAGGYKDTGNTSVTNNNDNGVTQNVTIVNPQRTPSENARELKKVGRDLALGY